MDGAAMLLDNLFDTGQADTDALGMADHVVAEVPPREDMGQARRRDAQSLILDHQLGHSTIQPRHSALVAGDRVQRSALAAHMPQDQRLVLRTTMRHRTRGFVSLSPYRRHTWVARKVGIIMVALRRQKFPGRIIWCGVMAA